MQHTFLVGFVLQHGPVPPPFGGSVTRIPTPPARVAPLPPPPAPEFEATSVPTEQPDFDIYTKDSLGGDRSRISPAFVFGYKNVRSAAHPWALEAGYKNIDSSTGHIDLLLGTGWATVWARRNGSLTVEEDASNLRGVQTRFDTYAIAEAVRSWLTIDLLAGATTARTVGTARVTDFLTGVMPIVQLSPHYSVVALYSIKNDVDGEDYYEASVARAFDRPALQLSLAIAKHGTYAVRFQKTLKHFTRAMPQTNRPPTGL